MMQALIKRITMNSKIIHENFYNFGDKVKKNVHYAPLNCGWCITSAKPHPSKNISAKRASECGPFLILKGY